MTAVGPKLPPLSVLKKRFVAQEPGAINGHWYFMLEDGRLIGDDSENPMNHFDAMQKAVGEEVGFDRDDDNFVFKAFYESYKAIRVSIDFHYREVNVQLLGQPTSAQLRSIATIVRRTENRITWDFGLWDKSGSGSIGDFQRALQEWM
jgi:hypothetical protein